MASKREQILLAIKAALLPTAGVSGRVYRSRLDAIDKAEAPCIVIKPKSEPEPTQTMHTVIDHHMIVEIEVIARGREPDSIADPVITEVHQRLMSDTTLGGLAMDIFPGTSAFEFQSADQDACLLTAEFQVWYRTSRNDLTA